MGGEGIFLFHAPVYKYILLLIHHTDRVKHDFTAHGQAGPAGRSTSSWSSATNHSFSTGIGTALAQLHNHFRCYENTTENKMVFFQFLCYDCITLSFWSAYYLVHISYYDVAHPPAKFDQS